ncbi:hypothetical protein [Uliginosibacterium sp. TH139]|uniref:hypothetical protein n=1 Tax=Uliginosibacterium sp. TH139 TaxID=2067453 RepID=UPI001180D7D1|nr:hypothetical protein [Uliginosibacterium sp. TH139]
MSVRDPEDINRTIKLRYPLAPPIAWTLIIGISIYIILFPLFSGIQSQNPSTIEFYWAETSTILSVIIGMIVISNKLSSIELTRNELKIFKVTRKSKCINLSDIDALFLPPYNPSDHDIPIDILVIHLRSSGVAEEVDFYGFSKTAEQFANDLSARISALRV